MEICSDSDDDDDCILLEGPDWEEKAVLIRDHVLGAVHAPEKPVIVLNDGLNSNPNINSDSEDCTLLEESSDEFPKPMNFGEMAGKSRLGSFLDQNNNLEKQKIETTVKESCSDIQENYSVEKAGPSPPPSIEDGMNTGHKNRSLINFAVDEMVQKLPEPKTSDFLEPVDSESTNSKMGATGAIEELSEKSENHSTNDFKFQTYDATYKSFLRSRPVRCLICGIEFKTNISLKKHHVDMHSDPGKHEKASIGTKKLTEAGAKKIWLCDRCGKNLGSKITLTQHFQIHNPTNEFTCRFCGESFKTSARRYQHEKIHTATKVQCKICGRELKSDLSEHRLCIQIERNNYSHVGIVH